MAVEQACTWTKSLILQLVSTDHLLEKKKALRNLPKNVISVISFWIIAFLAESSCFKDLAGNHGETNRGSLKITNLKQKKGSQKLFSFWKSLKMTIAFYSFIPPDMEAISPGTLRWLGGCLSLMPCHFPCRSFLSQSFHMPNPLLQATQLGPCLNKNQNGFQWNPHEWLQRLDDPIGKLRKPRIVITRRGSKMVQALHHALLHGPHRADLKAFHKASLKFPVIIGTI